MLQYFARRLVVALFPCAWVIAGAQGGTSEPRTTSSSKIKVGTHGKSKHDGNSNTKASAPETLSPSDTNRKDGAEKDQSAYAFGLPTADGKNLSLSDYKGKVLLVVNLGRQSSYAAQLPALEKLSETFKDQGLIILGVPSNDFGNAEPGTPAEIAKFYTDAKVPFPVMQVSSLIGVHELPLFTYLSKNKAVENDGLHWNYTKFLVDRKGKVLVCFPPEIAPDSLAMTATVREVLDGTWKPKKPEGKGKGSEDEGDDE